MQINRTVFPGIQGGPLMHIIAAKAVCFKEALNDQFKLYQQQVIRNAKTLSNSLQKLGYYIVSGGTENHLFTVNVKKSLGITGKKAEEILDLVGITCNKNTVPFDDEKPLYTSGIRLGTPAITSRGFKENEMKEIARLIDQALKNSTDNAFLKQLRREVYALTDKYLVYEG